MWPFRVKDCILVDCISFTAATMLVSLLSVFSEEQLIVDYYKYNIQMFVCTTLISVLIYFSSKIKIESQIICDAIALFIVGLVIVGVGGGIFQWFSFKKELIQVIAIFVTVYLITNFMMLWQNNELSKKINKKIKEREQQELNHKINKE